MVTIVSGSSLGLESSLQNTRTNVGGNVQGQNPQEIYVNSATGNLVVQDQDEVLSAIGPGLSLVRTYNSQGAINGDNWILSVNEQVLGLTGTVNTTGSTITKQFGDGSQILYTYNSTLGLYTSALGQGADDTLKYNSSTAQWTWTDGATQDTETYNSSGQLISSTDDSGNVTSYSYTGSLLTQITDPSGQITYLDYSGNNLTDIREVSNGATQKRVTYTYDSSNRLTSVAIDLTPANDSSGDPTYVTTYTYQGTTDLLASITQSDGTKVSFQYTDYDGSYRLSQYTDGNGNVTKFSYSGAAGTGATEPLYAAANTSALSTTSPPYYTVPSGASWTSITSAVYGTTDPNAVAALQAAMGNPTLTTGMHLTVPLTLQYTSQQTLITTTTVTDALGNVTTYTQNSAGRLTSVATPTGKTAYGYDTNGDVTSVTQDPSGLDEVTTYTYDGNGNLLTAVDADGDTTAYTYNSANQVLTASRYLVPAAGSTAASSPITTRYVYDTDNRLSYLISGNGEVTEYIYNSQGERTSTLVYEGAQYNVSGLSAGTAPTLSQMSTWAAAQNLTELERTDYTYDFRGNLSTSTVYGATSSSGAGVASTASTTQYVYDQRGQLLQIVDPRGSANAANAGNSSLPYATTYTYDGLGRVLTETRWMSSGVTETTSYQYTAAGNTITTTAANGLVTTSVYNADGSLLSQSSSSSGQSLGTTTYTYDADGLLRTVTNPDGIESHTLYDGSGRKVASVDGDGTLTQYVYNTVGEIVETIEYAGTVNTAALADVNGVPANVSLATLISQANTNPAANQVTHSVYNAAGQLVYSINAAGAVTENLYDGAGRVVETIAYATPVSIPASTGQMTPAQVPVVTSANDRTTRNFYDADGDLVGTLDAAGYLTVYQYNAADQLVQKTEYATATTASLRATGTLAQLTPASAPGSDVVDYYFYDGQGRQVGVIDGDGYLTQTEYDAAGNIAETIRYATPVTYSAGATLASLIPNGGSETTQYQYDGANRLVQQTNYQGTVTQYQYDAAGNLISTTVAAGTADARTTQSRYNALGQVIGQLTAEGSALITSGMTSAQINAIWAQYGVSYTYDAAGLRTSMTDANGHTSYYYYDDDGRLEYTVDAAGDVTETTYDAFGRTTSQIAYDTPISTSGLTGGLVASSNIASLVQAIANPQIDSSTTTTYGVNATGATQTTTTAMGDSVSEQFDAFGDVLAKTQAISATQSVTTDYAYDARGLLLTTTSDPTGLDIVQSNVYDAFGRLIQSTDGNGNVTKYAYDPLGRQVQTTDALGAVTSTTYDAFGRVLTTKDALGNTTSYSYNDSARSMTVTNPDGVAVTTLFNEFGQQIQVTDGNGNVTHYAYDGNGDLISTTDALGTESAATYSAAGLLLTSTDADGVVTSYTYDAANRVLTRTLDPSGLALKTSYTYDAQGRVISTTNTNGAVTTTQYDRDGRVTQTVVDPYNATTNPNGLNLVTTYAYNDAGDILTVTQGSGSSNPRVTQYTYDSLGRRIGQVVDPGTGNNPATGQPYLNLTTQYFYDADGNLVHTINADSDSTWYVYDADSRLRYSINALGGITETDYDADGRLIETRQYAIAMTPPASTVNRLTVSQVTPVASAVDRTERAFYDAAGQQVYTIDAAGTVTQRSYDQDGNVIQLRVISGMALTGTYANTAAVTAALGSAATTLGANDRVQWTAYDARDRAIVTIDATGAVTQTQYDGDGNVIATTQYATLVAPPSSLVTSISANTGGSAPTITVNGSGTITVASSSSDRTTRNWYDTAGRQVYTLSAAGYLTRTQYNDSARTQTTTVYATKPTIPAGASTSNLQNGTGGVVITPNAGTTLSTGQVVEADQTTTTYYDTDGRITKIVDALGHTQSYTYDALGNKLTYTNQNGQTWTYKYDAEGRLIEQDTPSVSVTNVTSSSGALTPTAVTASIVTLMTYDGLGNLLTLTEGIERLSNGTQNTSSERVTTYGYDALGRQVTVTLPAVPVYNGISTDNVDATGSAVGSDSTLKALTTQVVYDTLGDAIASRDAAGNWTYKVYDQLGRVVYEIDALNYVTGSTYDAFGNQLTTTRYATALSGSITGSTLTSLSASGTTITVTNGSTTSTVSVTASSQDRTITTTYDRDNRVKSVSQPAVYTFVPNVDAAGGQTFTASPTVFYDYNAFGQTVRTATLVNTNGNPITNPDVNPSANTWTYSYAYYDQAGNRIADVNADNYLTTYQYDAEGNLTQQYEYAQAASGISISGYTAPATSSTDRQTQYQYDQLNREVTQTLAGVQYTQMSGSAGSLSATSQSGNAVTYYGYDALGNQTSITINGATAYTYYDALGRVIATVGAASNRGDGTIVTPLTLMQRDAYGNLVVQTQYAAGLTSQPAAGAAPTTSNTTPNSNQDRTTIYLLDTEGHALETEQVLTSLNSGDGGTVGNVIQYDAYDALGNLVKQYQLADAADTLVTFYLYDALGRQTDVITPELLGSTDTVSDQYSQYNAFGEVTAKGTGAYGATKVYQEFADYDANGRVYLTNTGGAYTAYLYDLAGSATGTLQEYSTGTLQAQGISVSSAYNLSALGSQTSAASAYTAYTQGNSGLMFTQTRYDAMGNVVEQRLPTYSSSSATAALNDTSVQVQNIGGVEYLTWIEPADSTLVAALYVDGIQKTFVTIPGSGNEYGYEVGFALTGLADGTHSYLISYSRAADTSPYGLASGTFTVGQGLTISAASNGTVSSVSAYISGSTLNVSWKADNSSVSSSFSILVNGTWQTYSGTTNESGLLSAALTAPAPGTYQYRITDTLNGEVEAQGTGTVTITASSTSTSLSITTSAPGTVSSVSAAVSGSTATVSWVPSVGGTTAAFAILIGSTWTSYTPTLTESGAYTVSFPLPAAGSYQYRITDLVNGETQAQGTGSISFTAASTSTSLGVTAASPGTVNSVSAGVSGSSVIVSWVPSVGGTSATFAVLIGSTWTAYTPTLTESGAYTVSFPLPAAGSYQYRITDLVNGVTQAQGTGTITITGSSTSTSLSISASTPGTVNSVSAGVSGSTAIVDWVPSVGGTSATFAILLGSTWTSYTPSLTESGMYTVSFPLPAAGTYQYRITDLVNGVTQAQGTGTITFTASSSSTTTTGSSTPSAPWYTPSPVSASASVGTQGSGSIRSSATPVQTAIRNESGVITGYSDSWSGTDSVSLNWLNLASGTYTLNIYYQTAANSTYGISSVAASKSFSITGGSSGTYSWTDPTQNNSFAAGGISSISYFQILQNGTVVRDSRNSGVTTTTISWSAPSDTSYVGALDYALVGNGYTQVGAVRSGSTFQASLSELAPGTYNYIAEVYQNGAEGPVNLTQVSGQFVVSASSASISSQNGTPGYLSGVAVSGNTLTWAQAPQSGATVQAQLTGPGSYTLSPSTSNGTNYSASFYGIPSGTYTYQISYISGGSTYLEGTGTIAISTTTTTTPASASIGSPTELSAVSGFSDAGNGVLQWTTAANSGDSIVFHYKASGASSWAGTLTVSGSGPYAVNLSGLSGAIQYEVDYTASGAAQPYRVGTGTVTINRTTTPASASIGSPTQLSAVGGFTDAGNGVLQWTTAANSGDSIVFHYKASGASAWAGTLTVSGSGPYSVNLGSLSGTIQYEVDYTASGAAQPYRVGTGTVTINRTTTPATAAIGSPTELSSVSGFTDAGNGVLQWTTAANSGDSIVFHYKASGASAWAGTLTVSGSGPYSVNLGSLSGTIQYEVDYTASGAAQPYRVETGSVTINRTTTPETASISTPTELSAVSGFSDLGNGVLQWTTAANSGDSIVFHYKAAGASSWAGTLPVSGSGPYTVNLSSLSGTIQYEIDYTASGAAQPYRVGTGTVTINQTAGGLVDTTASLSQLQPTQAAPYELQTVDRWGNVTSVTNAAGSTTRYVYNAYNDLIQTTDPAVNTVSVAMAANGQTGTVSTVTGATPTSYSYYDLYGREIGSKDADGNIDGQIYNAANQVISQQDADGGQKLYVYDAFGDQIEVVTQINAQTSYDTRNAYDQAGRLTDTEQELVAGAFTAAGAADTGFSSNLLARTNVNIIRNTYVYDQAGRRIESIDGAGDVTATSYDLHGNVIATTTPTGSKTQYGYDVEDQKVSETDPDGNTQSWSYDFFGHLLTHVDMGGTTYTYTYDTSRSGLLTSMTSSGGQFAGENQTYSYDAANHLIQLNDAGVNSITYYEYDPYNRIDRQRTVDGGLVAEDTRTYYDAMGRISGMSGEGYSVSYSYDAAGNRTQIDAYYSTGPGAKSQQDLWYGYDAMNRVVISEGVDTNNTVAVNSTQGTILTYDWRGDRTSETTEGTIITESGATYSSSQGMGYYTYAYDGAARLLDTYVQPSAGSTSKVLLESRVYDQASRITQDTTETVASGSSSLSTTVQTNTYNADSTVKASSTKVNGLMQSAVAYTYTTESGTQSYYDAAGNLTGYVATYYDSSGNAAYSSTNTFTYAKGNSYLQTSQSVTSKSLESGVTAPENGETTYTYNDDQQLIQYTDTQKTTNNRYFLDNAQGQQLTVVQGNDGNYAANATTYGSDSSAAAAFSSALMSGAAFFQSAANAAYFFYDSNGNEVGTYGELGGQLTANFDVNFTPVSQQYPAQTPPQYVVQAGDTLASVAMRVYGDASLWYIIAQANGLTQTGPDAALAEGTALTIPNVVVDRSNNAQSFAPFNVSQALGNTTPTQPTPPPAQQSSGGGCGILGMILVMIVAIVATIYTAGLASEAIAADLGDATSFGTEAFATGAAVLGGSTAPITALSIGTDIASAAIGGAVGSMISQAVAVGIGEQSSFSWGSVATAALGSALGSALGGVEALGDTGTLAKTVEAGANALVSGAATQGAEIALGMEKTFNWDAVAASAVAAPISALVGVGATKWLGNDGVQDVESSFAGKFVSGGVGEIFKELFKNGQLSGETILTDAFGSAVGNSIVTAIAPPSPSPAAPAQGGQPSQPATQGSYDADGDFVNIPTFSAASFGNPFATTAAGGTVTATAAPDTDNTDLISTDEPEDDLEIDEMQLETMQSLPTFYTVQAGNTLSGILGTSNPAVIGEFMRENNLTNSTIFPGEQLIMPDGDIQSGDQSLGQAVLNNDNARIAALQALAQQAAAQQAAAQQAAAAAAQSNAAAATQPPPSTALSTTGSFFSGLWNGLKSDGQLLVSAGQSAIAWGEGQVNAYQQGGVQATVVGQAYNSTVQAYNSTVNFVSSEVAAYQQGGITNTQTAQAVQNAVTTVENTTEDAVNYVQTQGLSGLVADGENAASQMWGNVTNYWDTHSGDQMAYSVGNFVGGQLPIQVGIQTVAFFTAGAGESLEALDAGVAGGDAALETVEAVAPALEESASTLEASTPALEPAAPASLEGTAPASLESAPAPLEGGAAEPVTTAAPEAVTPAAAPGASGNYGVAFFGDSSLKYYNIDNATLGADGRSFFFMPLEDSSAVTNAADAARFTGNADSALNAYLSGGDAYGISFPTDGLQVDVPTAADAGGNPNFLEGGNTAVALPNNGGYLLNPTQEFVTPGGNPIPQGSVLFQVGPNGEWIPLKKF